QIFKILDPEKTKVCFNSSWMNEMRAIDLIRLCAKHTVARMLERDDFKKRFQEGRPIAIHEFIYPLIQGYDSVALRADVELGGTDQKFNLLVGRDLQREYGQEPQVVITMPLLEGLDGVHKMSKSLGNYVGITEPPKEMFGKLMSISDELMFRYFELLSEKSMEEIEGIRGLIQRGEVNPRDVKMELAMELVGRYHGEEEAKRAKEAFIEQFSKKRIPDDIPEARVNQGEKVYLPSFLKAHGLCSSASEGRRLIRQGALKIDGQKVSQEEVAFNPPEAVIKLGKRRYLRVLVDAQT
ncbi:MAG TPA: tyrosine--tRNA ligase, partial [Dissulfuribacter thermophilus]|nr:tyrosine--tRNA ligase [Dissulfuribacter thermophilus]